MDTDTRQVLVRLNLENLFDLRTAPWITTFSYGSFPGTLAQRPWLAAYPVEIYDFRSRTSACAQRYVDASPEDPDTARQLLLELEAVVNTPATLIFKSNAPNQLTVSLHEANGEPEGILIQRMQQGLNVTAPPWFYADIVHDSAYRYALSKTLVVGITSPHHRLGLATQPDEFRKRANLQGTLLMELGYIESNRKFA